MTVKLTGHAEIDRQHEILDELVARYGLLCRGTREASCRACGAEQRGACSGSLADLTEEMLAFLAGHVTYEEKLMDLLPAVAKCRDHIGGHKDAHADIAKRLRKLAGRVGKAEPLAVGAQLHGIVTQWLGDHTSRYDESLALQVENLDAAEIEFDSELVAILDEFVFRNRPTGANPPPLRVTGTRRQQVQARAALLSPRQREVCTLVAQGLANKEIANRLGITINTVKTHRAEVFRKLEVSSLLDLVRVMDVLEG